MDVQIQFESINDAEHTYKEFVYRLRKKYLDEIHLLITEDPAPQLCKYIILLLNVSLKESAYNEYYGVTKTIIRSFLKFSEYIIDENIVTLDRYTHSISKEELMRLADKTFNAHNEFQTDFLKQYSPCHKDQAKFDEIVQMHENGMQKISQLQKTLEGFRKQEEIDEFAKTHLPMSVNKIGDYIKFAHIFISVILGDRFKNIRLSLDTIVARIHTNFRKYLADYEKHLHTLHDELYDLHKEKINLSKKIRSDSVKEAELTKSIDTVTKKIGTLEKDATGQLVEEDRYWTKRLGELDEIGCTMLKMKRELDEMDEDEKKITSLRAKAGHHTACLSTLNHDFSRRRSFLKTKLVEISRCLVTFFTVKGADRILYSHSMGNYYLDEYGHKVYPKEFKLKLLHADHLGNFVKVNENESYYFDNSGRYIIKDNEKVYQCAPCTSQYHLGEDGRLHKITKRKNNNEQAHVEATIEPDSNMNVENMAEVGILPSNQSMDIKNVDTTEYLWNTFGWILPEVLNEVEKQRPKYPIHFLGHKLLEYRYRKNFTDIQNKKKEALKYRADKIQQSLMKAQNEALKWKSKLVKRRKPEESDDTQEKNFWSEHLKGHQFAAELQRYYD